MGKIDIEWRKPNSNFGALQAWFRTIFEILICTSKFEFFLYTFTSKKTNSYILQ